MRPFADTNTVAGCAALIASLLLASPGVQVVRADSLVSTPEVDGPAGPLASTSEVDVPADRSVSPREIDMHASRSVSPRAVDVPADPSVSPRAVDVPADPSVSSRAVDVRTCTAATCSAPSHSAPASPSENRVRLQPHPERAPGGDNPVALNNRGYNYARPLPDVERRERDLRRMRE